LSPIEQVENLNAKFHTRAPIAIQQEILESSRIEIINSIRAQSWIDTGLVAKGKVCRRRETRCIKPAVEPGYFARS
jgi:hypothetical protein